MLSECRIINNRAGFWGGGVSAEGANGVSIFSTASCKTTTRPVPAVRAAEDKVATGASWSMARRSLPSGAKSATIIVSSNKRSIVGNSSLTSANRPGPGWKRRVSLAATAENHGSKVTKMTRSYEHVRVRPKSSGVSVLSPSRGYRPRGADRQVRRNVVPHRRQRPEHDGERRRKEREHLRGAEFERPRARIR